MGLMVTGSGVPCHSATGVPLLLTLSYSGRVDGAVAPLPVGGAGGPGIRSLAHARGLTGLVCRRYGLNLSFVCACIVVTANGPPIGHPIHQPEWRWGWREESNEMLKLMGVCGAPTGVAMRCRKRAFVRQASGSRHCSGCCPSRRPPSLIRCCHESS